MGGVSADAAQVAKRVLSRLDSLIERLGAAYRAVPEYDALPPGVMETEVLPVSREIVEVFLDAAIEGREAAVHDVSTIEMMGERRLEMGVPLEPMLHVYRIAGREVFDEIVAATGPDEKHALAELGRAWMDYIDRASSVAASGYLHASHERLRRIDAQRGALLDSLLSAADVSDAAAVAAEFAITLAPRYVVVLVAGQEVATRIDRLAAVSPAGSLTGFRGAQVVVLVPEALPDLAAFAAEVPGAIVAHGRAVGPGADLAGEMRRTESVLAAALARGIPGSFGPDDLVLEQLVGTNPRLAAALRRSVIERLRQGDRDALVESTLRTFLRTGSIPETARAESVHPNTVAYRLRRVMERVGLDPRIPDQAATLSLAFVADDLSQTPQL